VAEEVDLSPEQEVEAERIFARIEGKMLAAIRQLVRRLVRREPEEMLGAGEFELRDGVLGLGAQVLEESLNERAKSKKGVPGC
jgi:hypothetical protein